jgi:hypothetical protein
MKQYIQIAAYYIISSVCLVTLEYRAKQCETYFNSILQLLNSTESVGTGSGDSRVLFFSLLFPTMGASVAFVMTLCILVLIIRIVYIVKNDNQPNLRLMYLWLLTHVWYTLLALVEVVLSFPRCTPNQDLMFVSEFSSIWLMVMTLCFLKEVDSYKRQLKVRPNRNTQDTQDTQDTQMVSQNTTSSEVPPVFKRIICIQKWPGEWPSGTL